MTPGELRYELVKMVWENSPQYTGAESVISECEQLYRWIAGTCKNVPAEGEQANG